MDRETMARGEQVALYLDDKARTVSNWPGSLVFSLIRRKEGKRHALTGVRRIDFWFAGPDGKEWHGFRAGQMDLAYCKPTKRPTHQNPVNRV
jgi:hypothetical protein